jgi:hypothetical protein
MASDCASAGSLLIIQPRLSVSSFNFAENLPKARSGRDCR